MNTHTDPYPRSPYGNLECAPRETEWRKWLKANKTNEMVWPFNLWEAHEESDDLRAVNHKLQERILVLARCLGQAWEIGSNHRRPTFEQLNQWRSVLANIEA